MKWGIKEKTNLLLGLFVAALVMSNILGSKITEFNVPSFIYTPLNIIFFPVLYILKAFLHGIGGREIPLQFFNSVHVSVGILTFPLMFLITDVIEEVYGKKKVKEFIVVAVFSMLLLILVTSIAVALPAAERSHVDQETYAGVFGITIRMAIASIIAFVMSQMHDMWSFAYWKKKTRGRFFWLRNNLSTIVSQLIDSTVFMFIAFWRSAPMFDTVFVISLIVPYWIFKILFAIIDTPFAYLGVWWLRGKNDKD